MLPSAIEILYLFITVISYNWYQRRIQWKHRCPVLSFFFVFSLFLNRKIKRINSYLLSKFLFVSYLLFNKNFQIFGSFPIDYYFFFKYIVLFCKSVTFWIMHFFQEKKCIDHLFIFIKNVMVFFSNYRCKLFYLTSVDHWKRYIGKV